MSTKMREDGRRFIRDLRGEQNGSGRWVVHVPAVAGSLTLDVRITQRCGEDPDALVDGLTVTGGGIGTDTLTLTGSASVATYQNALRTVTFENNDEPSILDRTIEFIVEDSNSTASNASTQTVSVALDRLGVAQLVTTFDSVDKAVAALRADTSDIGEDTPAG